MYVFKNSYKLIFSFILMCTFNFKYTSMNIYLLLYKIIVILNKVIIDKVNMNSLIFEAVMQCFYLVLVLSLPPILVASITGILLALIQAVTQLQEQTLSFGIKLIAVILTLFLTADWFSTELLKFSQNIFDKFFLLQ